MEMLSQLAISLFDVTSMWSVVLRGIVWLVIAGGIIVATDSPHPEVNTSKLRQNLGFLLLVIVVSGTLIYLLFGYAAAPKA
jgi:hypothetical protein